jgi:hypothetical protein
MPKEYKKYFYLYLEEQNFNPSNSESDSEEDEILKLNKELELQMNLENKYQWTCLQPSFSLENDTEYIKNIDKFLSFN